MFCLAAPATHALAVNTVRVQHAPIIAAEGSPMVLGSIEVASRLRLSDVFQREK